jgi:hypothetical protein
MGVYNTMKKVNKILLIAIIFFIFCIGAFLGIKIGLFFEWNKNDYFSTDRPWPLLDAMDDTGPVPEEGFVPDERTAIKIAKIVWEPIYGKKDLIWNKYEYRIELIDDSTWVIEGLNQLGRLGGGPCIKIDKQRGTILGVGHTK